MNNTLFLKTGILAACATLAFGCAQGTGAPYSSVAPTTPSVISTHSDISSYTFGFTDYILATPATYGTCTINNDITIITYTPPSSSFNGTDSCYYSSVSVGGVTITVDYVDPENPVANAQPDIF